MTRDPTIVGEGSRGILTSQRPRYCCVTGCKAVFGSQTSRMARPSTSDILNCFNTCNRGSVIIVNANVNAQNLVDRPIVPTLTLHLALMIMCDCDFYFTFTSTDFTSPLVFSISVVDCTKIAERMKRREHQQKIGFAIWCLVATFYTLISLKEHAQSVHLRSHSHNLA